MSLVAIGINHKTATVDLREKVAFSPDKIHDAMKSLASRTRSGEAVISRPVIALSCIATTAMSRHYCVA